MGRGIMGGWILRENGGDRMTSEVIEKYIERHREVTQGPVQLDLKLH